METPSKLWLMKLQGSDKYVLLSPTKKPNAGEPTVYTGPINLEPGNYLIKTDVPISTSKPKVENSHCSSKLMSSLKLNTGTCKSPQTADILQKPLIMLMNNESMSSPCPAQMPGTSVHLDKNITLNESSISAVSYNNCNATGCSAKSQLIAANINLNTCNSNKTGSKKTSGVSQKTRKYKKIDDNNNKKSTSKSEGNRQATRKHNNSEPHANPEPKKVCKTKAPVKHEGQGQSTKVKSIPNKEKCQGRPKQTKNSKKHEIVTKSTSSSSLTKSKTKNVRKVKKSKSEISIRSSNELEIPEKPTEPMLPYQKYSQVVQVINSENSQIKKSLNNIPVFFMCGTRGSLATDSETDCPVVLLTDKKKQVIHCVMVDKMQPGAYLINFERQQQDINPFCRESSHIDKEIYSNTILTKAILSPYYYSLTSPMKGQHMVLFNVFEDDPYGPEIFTDTTIDNIASAVESDVEVSKEHRPCTHPLYDVMVTKMKEMDQRQTKDYVTPETKRPKFQLRVQLFDKRQLKRMKAKESDEENYRAE